jgi:hypothetical protein
MNPIPFLCALFALLTAALHAETTDSAPLQFDLKSVRNGPWSEPQTWEPARVPKQGERVLVSAKTKVLYDRQGDEVIRLIQVAGQLTFARDRNTTLNVGLLKVQNSERCSENGFRCDLHDVTAAGEPSALPAADMPALEVGTAAEPIPANFTARIRLHYLEGMSKDDAPALSACSARMDLHGAPMNRTWVKLGAEAKPGQASVTLAEAVTGWRVGDEVIVTGSVHGDHDHTFRQGQKRSSVPETEERVVTAVDGLVLTLNRPLENVHFGTGDLRSEVANLSRNVIVESADPNGVRGHTIYHQFSSGGISYARFAHLGKEGVLGRYPIHFHLVEDTMRGAGVIGAAIVDSHNRWVTLHGSQYLLIRDCVGYQSVGHGFFMEDGSEVFNLLDRNLGVQAFRGKPLPKQVLGFDPNEGAAFWWANGHNSLTRNVSCENDEYGYRYDSQSTRSFNSTLAIRTGAGAEEKIDIRTIPFFRFESNEAHTEGLYGMTFAGNNQAGDPIDKAERLAQIDRTGPDSRHPHIVRDAKIWQVHYGLRPQVPTMLLEQVHIDSAVYGIYRPALENHVYRDLRLTSVSSEPFNRGMDDASTQTGRLTVDGLTFQNVRGDSIPLIQISDNNVTGQAESHFRNVRVLTRKEDSKRALVDRGGGARTPPVTAAGVPVYLHDYYGPGRTAKIISTAATALMADGTAWRKEAPLTGPDSVVAEVHDIPFPQLLDPVDDLAPVTFITGTRTQGDQLIITGVSHDNGEITGVTVNGQPAKILSLTAGVADWQITLPAAARKITAFATDKAGNTEKAPHHITLAAELPRTAAK